ncbi:MAG: O-antigen ligase family protein [Bacteroidales bacterium]
MHRVSAFLSQNRYEPVYLTGLILFALGLPLSKTAMSLALFLLAAHWLIAGSYRHFPSPGSSARLAFGFFMLIPLMHIAGLLYTADFAFAAKDLRIKLPLLLLPLFLVTGPHLSRRSFNLVIDAFILAVTAGTIISFVIFLTDNPVEARDLTPFVSHIRFSMMVVLAAAVITCMAFNASRPKSIRILAVVLLPWLIFSLAILEVLTGLVAFALLLFAAPVYIFITRPNLTVRLFSAFAIFVLLAALALSWNVARKEFIPDLEEKKLSMRSHTALGNPYTHDLGSLVNENGNMVWMNVCEDEMRTAWNDRSSHAFDSELAPGSRTSDVLMRYLSSLGYTKDAEGVDMLTVDDITAIERGITNYEYSRWNFAQRRFDQLKWEYWNYLAGGDPKGHSLLQRWELWKVGSRLANDNLLIGVGTGDLKKAFATKLSDTGSSLAGTPLRAHNQYLTILITFGIIGLTLFLAALIVPLALKRSGFGFPMIAFLIIAFASMFFEDTLETQVGVSFFAYFYAMWVFQRISRRDINHQSHQG